jgi:hypothetical protein
VRPPPPDRPQEGVDRLPPSRWVIDLHRPHRPHHQHLATTRHPQRLHAGVKAEQGRPPHRGSARRQQWTNRRGRLQQRPVRRGQVRSGQVRRGQVRREHVGRGRFRYHPVRYRTAGRQSVLAGFVRSRALRVRPRRRLSNGQPAHDHGADSGTSAW